MIGLRTGIIAALLLCLLAMPAAADAGWPVQNRLLGKLKDGKAEKAEDVSGIACAPGAVPRLCLAVDDETQGAQVVILTEGGLIAGDFIRLIDDSRTGKPLELDAEGVAYADDFFYVVGSQGRARHETDADKEATNQAKAAATRKVFRIALSADLATGELTGAPTIAESDALATMLQSDPALAPFVDLPLSKNGLTVEGIAVRGDDLYAGLRGPVLADGSAVIAKVPLAALFEGKAGAVTLYRLNLGKDSLGDARGIRDLTADQGGFLLIAGPENDPPKKHKIEDGDYAVYSWNEVQAIKLVDLAAYGKKVKPEALLPLDGNGAMLRALLLFDGAKEGMPTPVEIPLQ